MNTKPAEVQTQVVGTTRTPEGAAHGEIKELILAQKNSAGEYQVLDIPESIVWARRNLLWSAPPNGGPSAWVEPYDANRDGKDDSVRSKPDLLAAPRRASATRLGANGVEGRAAEVPPTIL
ncbi:MAG TPA: hypothetical protein VHE35_36995 [Kofleriaceae bacterium]|nr:hypothetical protein [Kofleriaceae bacterium]